MTPIVCLIQNKAPIDQAVFQFLLQFSPPEKQQRILRQRIKQNADSMTIGGALARYMLWKEFCIPWDSHIAYGEFGKPYLSDYPDIHFNISHSGQYVACAVLDRPIGIDVQIITRYQPKVAQRICNRDEYMRTEASSNPAYAFIKLWTQKEAALKMIGCGIGHGFEKNIPLSVIKEQSYEYSDMIITAVWRA